MPQLRHAERLDDIVLAFMIEKDCSMAQLEEICSIEGVDMVQFAADPRLQHEPWKKQRGHRG